MFHVFTANLPFLQSLKSVKIGVHEKRKRGKQTMNKKHVKLMISTAMAASMVLSMGVTARAEEADYSILEGKTISFMTSQLTMAVR